MKYINRLLSLFMAILLSLTSFAAVDTQRPLCAEAYSSEQSSAEAGETKASAPVWDDCEFWDCGTGSNSVEYNADWWETSSEAAPGQPASCTSLRVKPQSENTNTLPVILYTTAVPATNSDLAALTFWIKDDSAGEKAAVNAYLLDKYDSICGVSYNITGASEWKKVSLPTMMLPDNGYVSPFLRVSANSGKSASQPVIAGFTYETLEILPCEIKVDKLNNEYTVTLACPTDDTDIFYTLDGSVPDKTSSRYTAPLKVPYSDGNAVNLCCVAFKNDKNSALAFKTLEFGSNFVLPQINPSAGAVPAGTNVALSSPVADASLYYTTDGSEPDKSLTQSGGSTTVVVPAAGQTARAEFTISKDLTLRTALKYKKITSSTLTFAFTTDDKADKYEANNTQADATGLGFPFFIDATVHSKEDVDWYSTYFTGGIALIALTQPDSAIDYSVELYDENGTKIAGGADANSHARGITTQLEPGRYYVKVEGGGKASAKTYRLKFTKSAAISKDFSEISMARTELLPMSPYAYQYSNAYTVGITAGGHYQMATAYLSRWAGPVDESTEPYPAEYYNIPYFYTQKELWAYLHTLDKYYEHSPAYFLQNALWMPNRSVCSSEAELIAHIKNAIYCYGAVDVTYNSSQGGRSGESNNYIYDRFSKSINHSITLIGWDDNIPKENFTNSAFGTPKNDGGWIMKNSWGSDSGENGYYYISYETLSLGCVNAETVYQIDELAGEYNRQYVHDELGGIATLPANSSAYYIKSRFTSKSSETLKAVSFTTSDCDFDYEVYVNTDISKNSGLGKLAASGSKTYAGYYTITLGDGFPLQKDAQYEVTVRLESRYGNNLNVMLECADHGMVAVIDPNETFVSLDGKSWSDLATCLGSKVAATVRAFTKDESLGSSFETVGTQKAKYNEPEYEAMRKKLREEADSSGSAASTQNATASGAPAGAVEAQSNVSAPQSAPSASLPSKFDTRDYGIVSPVKDQGGIGSCWSFAAIASSELTFMRNYNTVQTEGAVSLDRSAALITLTSAAPEQIYTARAGITLLESQPNQTINWSFAGDLDSITVLNRTSGAGEAVQLFTAKKPGSIVVTSSTGYANVKSTAASVTIVSETPAPAPTPDSGSSSEEKTTKKPVDPIVLEIGDARPTMSNAGRLLEKHIDGGKFSVYSSGSALVLNSADGKGTLTIDDKLNIEFLQKCGVEKLTLQIKDASVDIAIARLSGKKVSVSLNIAENAAENAVSKTVSLNSGDLELPLTLKLEGEPTKAQIMLVRFDGEKWVEVPDGILKLQSVKTNGKYSRKAVTKPLSSGIYAIVRK